MVKVKICGLRRIDDIEFINKLRPDYAGFVFAESKRQVDINLAYKLISKLDKNIKTVGVFVNESIDKVLNTAMTLKLNILQFHGDETMDYIKHFKDFIVWKAIRVKCKSDIEKINQYDVDAVLLDSFTTGNYGGTGRRFDWDILREFKINIPVILAGGLNASNIEDAIKKVKPYAVDVSSGVETEGHKDFNKIKEFIKKVREIS